MELNFKETGIKEMSLFLLFSRKDFIEEVGFRKQLECKILERFGVPDMVCGLGNRIV